MTWRSQHWSGLTPPLCERCWFPVPARDAISYRITPLDEDEALYGFAHPERACTPQEPETHNDSADEHTHRAPRDGTEQ